MLYKSFLENTHTLDVWVAGGLGFWVQRDPAEIADQVCANMKAPEPRADTVGGEIPPFAATVPPLAFCGIEISQWSCNFHCRGDAYELKIHIGALTPAGDNMAVWGAAMAVVTGAEAQGVSNAAIGAGVLP